MESPLLLQFHLMDIPMKLANDGLLPPPQTLFFLEQILQRLPCFNLLLKLLLTKLVYSMCSKLRPSVVESPLDCFQLLVFDPLLDLLLVGFQLSGSAS